MTNMNQKVRAWIKLSQIADIGSMKARKIITLLGEPEEHIGKGFEPYEEIAFLNDEQKRLLAADDDPPNWDNICRLMDKHNIEFVAYTDDDYPERLNDIFDPPLFLFYRGQLTSDKDIRSLAIVGTRKPDNYGIMMTRKITADIVSAGFTIVSGLAFGIDTISHSVAVENNGRTIAVLGTGCESVYPPKNEKLAAKIIENGALISEYIPGIKPEKWFFSNRNRLISALSLGTFIVQGKKSSGALITARCALEQNRDVFALPGDINREQSEGPNYLIKSGAKIVTKPEDILEEYDMYLFSGIKKDIELSDMERKILELVKDNRPEISYDNIVMKTGISIGELSAVILSLEMKNLIFVGSANMVSAKD